MQRFFEALRRFIDWASRVLVTVLAILCVIVAFEAPSFGAPPWVAWLFGLFGIALLASNFLLGPKKGAARRPPRP